MKSSKLSFFGLSLAVIISRRFDHFCVATGAHSEERDDGDDSSSLFTTGFDVSESVGEYRYIIKFKSKKALRAARGRARRAGSHIMDLLAENSEVMTLRSMKEVKQWEERDDVEYVEQDHKVYLQQAESVPYGIKMVEALEVSDEFVSNQKVCIIDTGYDLGHPDLPSDPEIVTGTIQGNLKWFEDGNGHGTHVAGTIAALANNGQGVVGVNRNGQLKLHIVKVFGNNGNWAWGSTLIAAANACVSNGSTIISMSLGGPSYSFSEEKAFEQIYNSGVIIVAASGNNGSTGYSYPASYPSIISVGAINSGKGLASFSQRNDQVDLVAPGVGVRSTFPDDSYRSLSGTSMSTPHVSGVAALVWSHYPGKSAQEIRLALEQSAEDLGAPGLDNSFGNGLVSADRAFKLLDGACLPVCTDSPIDWYDSDGPEYNCAFYSQGRNCEQYGDQYENFGKTANEACCACGGGKTSCDDTDEPSEAPISAPVPATDSPTKSPAASPSAAPSKAPVPSTAFPSSSPEAGCQDSPKNWYDSDGEDYNCLWYGSDPGNCRKYGNSFAREGKTANEACCVCGGGTQPCEDVEGWYDNEGPSYDCSWYKWFNRCARFGDKYSNFGYTANEACCACKGF